MTAQRFETVLQSDEGSPSFIEVPFDVPAVFGKARAPVRGTLDGTQFRSTVAVYGGRYYLPVNRALRERAGVSVGQTVTVELERDDAPRTVEVPAELAAALDAAPAARAAFDRLSHSHQREYVNWVIEAKREATRERRLARTVELLQEGAASP
jgi:Bacteriocin-protection, YdeI or OmpD-Associated/Domain of unknown function (DUF1905)